MDVGVIILCPDRNPGTLRITVRSVAHRMWDRECIAVVGNDATKDDIAEMKEQCPTVYKGKGTITSLVNKGFYHLKHEWGFLMFAGSHTMNFLECKFKFATKDEDILFPVVENRYNFVDGSFNGVLINKKFFKKVGKFSEGEMMKEGMNDFEMAKLMWCCDAMEKGACFKGIVGMRVI